MQLVPVKALQSYMLFTHSHAYAFVYQFVKSRSLYYFIFKEAESNGYFVTLDFPKVSSYSCARHRVKTFSGIDVWNTLEWLDFAAPKNHRARPTWIGIMDQVHLYKLTRTRGELPSRSTIYTAFINGLVIWIALANKIQHESSLNSDG